MGDSFEKHPSTWSRPQLREVASGFGPGDLSHRRPPSASAAAPQEISTMELVLRPVGPQTSFLTSGGAVGQISWMFPSSRPVRGCFSCRITHLLDCHWFCSVLRRLALRKSHNDREFEIRCRRSTEELSTGPGKQNMILLVQRLHGKFAAGTEIMPLPTRRIV